MLTSSVFPNRKLYGPEYFLEENSMVIKSSVFFKGKLYSEVRSVS